MAVPAQFGSSTGLQPQFALDFEFWDDTQYSSFAPADQGLLASKLLESPRPTTVTISGGKYHVTHFQEVERGLAVQVNIHTGFERVIRLRPPYLLPNAARCAQKQPLEFEWEDNGAQWKKYSKKVQHELRQWAKCAPLPTQLFFVEKGFSYCLIGLDSLAGGDPQMAQINVKTNKQRRVRAVPQRGASSSSSAGIPRPLPASGEPFSLSAARFELSNGLAVDPVAMEVLLESWGSDPRPGQVTLPSGDVVQDFSQLEAGGAWVTIGGQRVHVRVRLPRLQPGEVVLPDELDVDEDLDLGMYGRYLSDAEVAALPSRGPDCDKCPICLCAIECDGAQQPAAPSNAPADSNQPDARGSGAFQLRCGHAYHAGCLEQWFASRRRCPSCQKEFGKVIGKQPGVGTMQWHIEPGSLPGHADVRHTIVIQFNFPAGVDEDGAPHNARQPIGYLPCNTLGILQLELFKLAFRRRVMFGLGQSLTLGTHRPTYNIHIKTSRKPRGAAGHGYPDDGYFQRSLEELRSNGVTISDLAQ